MTSMGCAQLEKEGKRVWVGRVRGISFPEGKADKEGEWKVIY
jgi:hypothetical protein